ncbi:hypothetical protein [Catenuloplanes indicus]|uniref:Membrane-associated phospholipid phosphatase n=1 Tax=Catenuloplanes indicus TaxID=137267 RepID=A0AAE3W653_9ACTN|nr:hypothetical protein [Catenuloplanes indicus]MDQ0370598.1 membrane-associated phospholipid phosphatase [Catenuloplanes indicus]
MSVTAPEKTTVDRLARVITEAFAPTIWAVTMPFVFAIEQTRSPAGFWWALLAAIPCALIPYGIVRYGVMRGTLTDHHIGRREQRRTPLLLAIASVLAGLLLIWLLEAPSHLIGIIVVMLGVLTLVMLSNLVWKLSVHAAVAAASTIGLIWLFGPPLLILVPVVAAVAWSRVRLADHTWLQVAAGTAGGAAVAMLLGPLFF